MKKLFTKEVLARGVAVGIVGGFVMIVIAACAVHADTTISTLINNTTDSALSTPVLSLTGNWITGGTSSTTKPHMLIEPTGTASNNWSANGTGLGVNAASGFTGNVADFQLNGTSLFKVASTGDTSVSGGLNVSGSITQNGTAVVTPPGTMTMFAGATAPTGYLLCDGSSYSTTTYPALFAVIGYTYGGAGNTFNVPDMRGRVPDGVSSGVSGITDKTLGQTGGSETHTLTVDEIPPISETVNIPVGGSVEVPFSLIGGDNVLTEGSQTITTNSVGGGSAFNVLNPYLAVNYIIKY